MSCRRQARGSSRGWQRRKSKGNGKFYALRPPLAWWRAVTNGWFNAQGIGIQLLPSKMALFSPSFQLYVLRIGGRVQKKMQKSEKNALQGHRKRQR
jgi:hypothetical protein